MMRGMNARLEGEHSGYQHEEDGDRAPWSSCDDEGDAGAEQQRDPRGTVWRLRGGDHLAEIRSRHLECLRGGNLMRSRRDGRGE